MKNILFLHSSSELYGSDRSLLNLIRNLDKKKYKLYVILPSEGPLFDELKDIEGIIVTNYNLAVLRRKNLSFKGAMLYSKEFVSSYMYLKKFIKSNHIDIVYTNTAVVFPGAIAAKHSKVKNIWHVREIINNRLERNVISTIINRFADTIIANSKATGISICKNSNKLHVVYNAVDTTVEINSNNKNADVVIGMAGRINRWKGQELFVQAAKIIHEKYPKVKFYIAGSAYNGEEYLEDNLKKTIVNMGLNETVILLGQIEDMSSFYNSIDIFVLPSIQPEPFGLVLIEAMERGIPVIATNHGGPVEIIENGKSGLLVDFNHPYELANSCINLIQDVDFRKKLGYVGKKRKEQMFSLKCMVDSIEKILDSV